MRTPSLFRVSVAEYAKRFGVAVDAMARQVSQELAQNVVEDTPVDTGFLRSSWQPSLNAPVVASAAAGDPSGGAVQAQIGTVVAEMKAGDRFWMVNNAAYALRLEYGFVGTDSLGRTYNQSGRYFVTDNMKRADAVASKIAKELGAK